MKSKLFKNEIFFRADIEGMRAIAILLVIAAHFSVPGFAAGFIGVDIFFVISGYLITSILVQEYEKNQTINLTRFYASRFRRLLPALATMIIVSSYMAYLFFPSSKNLIHSQAGAMSILWMSNIYFAFADINYFAAESTENIFLHTWSLGVEEQFYFLWPILILSALGVFKTKKNHLRLCMLFIIIALSSFFSSILFSENSPLIAFYMMPARAWQFSIGAMVWFLSRYYEPSKNFANILGCFGLFLLSLGMFFIDANSVYPSTLAMLPTFSAAIILWVGSNQIVKPLSNKIISVPIMQKIGRISYSWYLWHWPVLIISEQFLLIKGQFGNSFLAIAFSLLLANITFHFVENPIRFGRFGKTIAGWQITIAIIIMIVIFSNLLLWHSFEKEQLESGVNEIYSRALADIPIIYRDACDEPYQTINIKPCIYGDKNAKKTAVLLGDSIGAQWFSALTNMHDPLEWRIIVLTKSSCPIVDENLYYARIGREYTECKKWRNKVIEWLQQQHVERLFIGSTASSDFTEKQWKKGTERILEHLIPHADAIYLIEANPILTFNGPDCLLRNKTESSRYKKCKSVFTNDKYINVANVLKLVTQLYPTVHFIETSSFVCPMQQCAALIKKENGREVVTFRDAQHLTNSFVSLAANYFNEQIMVYEKIEK